MVDPISLMLTERIADHAIQFASRSQIAAERLFDNHACPASFLGLVQAGGLEMFQDRLELVGRDSEIKEPVAAKMITLNGCGTARVDKPSRKGFVCCSAPRFIYHPQITQIFAD